MRIPYGQSNFAGLREDGAVYVDKTRYIEVLENENAHYQFFIRPRRFGKSLFVSMLEHYYDVNGTDNFEKLFGGLYIGEHPTPRRSSYLVLSLSFSAIVTTAGKDRLMQSFDYEVRHQVDACARRYAHLLKPTPTTSTAEGAEQAVKRLVQLASEAGQKMMVLIDDCDFCFDSRWSSTGNPQSAEEEGVEFTPSTAQTPSAGAAWARPCAGANDLIGKGHRDLYEDLMHGEGYVRTFYKALKEGTRSCIERIFLTGVSPIMLDDLTSGFNITKNLTVDPRLNEMMGFTEGELSSVIDAVGAGDVMATDDLLTDMRRLYNGYLFHGSAPERLYNSDMVLSFLDQMVALGTYPESILDDNVKTDYHKIRELAFNFKDEELLDRLLADETVLSRLITGGAAPVIPRPPQTRPVEFSPSAAETPGDGARWLRHAPSHESRENFVSILFYMGLLTIDAPEAGWIRFRIPNYVIRTIYWEYLQQLVEKVAPIRTEDLRRAVGAMRTEGDIAPFAEYVGTVLAKLSNRDLITYDEKHLKAVILTLLHVDGLYLIESEYEAESGYVDIVLSADRRYERWVNYEWVIELKYLSEGKRHLLEQTQTEAKVQLQRYLGEKLQGRIKPERLRTATMVVVGKSDVVGG